MIMERILIDDFINPANLKQITIFKKDYIYTVFEDGIKIGSFSSRNLVKGFSKKDLRQRSKELVLSRSINKKR
jgi:hypothetical protein